MSVRAKHIMNLGLVKVIRENIDRLTTEKLQPAAVKSLVPKLLENDRRIDLPVLPEHPDHLAIGANGARPGARAA